MKRFSFLTPLFLAVVMFLAACTPNIPDASETPQEPAAQEQDAPATEEPDAPVAQDTDAGAEPITIEFWIADAGQRDEWEEMIERYMEQNPHVTVNSVPLPWADAMTRLQTAAATGTLPDASSTITEFTVPLNTMGAIAPLQSFFEDFSDRDYIADVYIQQITDSGDGDLIFLPTFASANFIWYRTDWFEEAGIPSPETFDDFFYAVEALTGDGRYGFGFRGGPGNFWPAVPFIMNYADSLYQFDDDGVSIFRSDIALEGFERFMSIPANGWSPADAINHSFPEMAADFGNGVSAMFIHHLGSRPLIMETLTEDQFGVLPLPVNSNGNRRVAIGPHGVQMFSNASNQQETFDFISFFLLPEQQHTIALHWGGIPANANTITEGIPFLDDAIAMVNDPRTSALREPLHIPEYSIYGEQHKFPDIQSIMLGETTPEEVLLKWAEDIEEMNRQHIALEE